MSFFAWQSIKNCIHIFIYILQDKNRLLFTYRTKHNIKLNLSLWERIKDCMKYVVYVNSRTLYTKASSVAIGGNFTRGPYEGHLSRKENCVLMLCDIHFHMASEISGHRGVSYTWLFVAKWSIGGGVLTVGTMYISWGCLEVGLG